MCNLTPGNISFFYKVGNQICFLNLCTTSIVHVSQGHPCVTLCFREHPWYTYDPFDGYSLTSLHLGIRYKLYCKRANVTIKAFYTKDADHVGNKSSIISSTLTKLRVCVHCLSRSLFTAVNACKFPSHWFVYIQRTVTLGFWWVSLLWKNIFMFFFYVYKCLICIYICVPCPCSVPLWHQNL